MRVTCPGGWIELVELKGEVLGEPATRRLLELLLQLAGSRGLDRTGLLFRQLDEYLRRVGLADVQRRDVDVPIGDWGGMVGSLMATDLRALYTRLSGAFQATLGLSAAECNDLVAAMTRELNEYPHRQHLRGCVRAQARRLIAGGSGHLLTKLDARGRAELVVVA
jgi:hypothetical protein